MALPLKRAHVLQDMPPPGGYKPLDFTKRTAPNRLSGVSLFVLVTGTVTYGLYRVINTNTARREKREEKRESRAALIPFMQATEDARFCEQEAIQNARDKRVAAYRYPDWDPSASVYKTDIWTPRPLPNRESIHPIIGFGALAAIPRRFITYTLNMGAYYSKALRHYIKVQQQKEAIKNGSAIAAGGH